VGSTVLGGDVYVISFWIQNRTLIGGDPGAGAVRFWKYPEGGTATTTISGFRDPAAMTISLHQSNRPSPFDRLRMTRVVTRWSHEDVRGASRGLRCRRFRWRGVARVGVADDAEAGVGCKDAGEALAGFVGAVGDDYHAGMQAVADADAAAVMKAHPVRAGGRVEQRVENRPVGDCIASVFIASVSR